MTTRLPGILVLDAEPSGACASAHPARAASRADRRCAGVPAASLAALVTTIRLRVNEWRVLIAVLAASGPISARQLARRLRLDPSTVRRVVRGLVAWSLLERTPAGLRFQPDASRWRDPTATHEPGS